MMFSDEQKFLIFVKFHLSVFSFIVNGFYGLIKNIWLPQGYEGITLHYFLEALLFYLSHLDLHSVWN